MSTWVLLRGLGREQRHWGAFPALLGEAVAARRVVALDLPGNGQLNHLPSLTRVEAMAAWVDMELGRRALAPPYHVLALSLGAMVAVAWAQSQPRALRAAVLINTSMRPFSPGYRRVRPSALGAVLRSLAAAGDPARRERRVLALVSNKPEAIDAAYPQWLACARENPVSTVNVLRQLWAAARFRARPEPPQVPLLVLTSAQDRMVHADCSRVLARQWGCSLAEHASAGHDLPLDDGPWVVRQVAHWLA